MPHALPDAVAKVNPSGVTVAIYRDILSVAG
jgi:hypothetical protein